MTFVKEKAGEFALVTVLQQNGNVTEKEGAQRRAGKMTESTMIPPRQNGPRDQRQTQTHDADRHNDRENHNV